MTGKEFVEEAMQKLNDPNIYQDYSINGIILMGSTDPITYEGIDIPVLPLGDEAMRRIRFICEICSGETEISYASYPREYEKICRCGAAGRLGDSPGNYRRKRTEGILI